MRTAPVVAIDLDAAEIEDEAVAERGVDLVVLVGGVSSGGVQNTVSRSAWFSSGTRPGDQWLVAASRENGDGVVGIAARARAAACELDLVGRDIELRGRDAAELVLDPQSRRDAPRRRPRRQSGSNSCPTRSTRRPRGVELGDDANVGRLRGRAHRRRPAPARCDGPGPAASRRHAPITPPSGSSATVAVACAPFFGPALRRSSGVSTVVM